MSRHKGCGRRVSVDNFGKIIPNVLILSQTAGDDLHFVSKYLNNARMLFLLPNRWKIKRWRIVSFDTGKINLKSTKH